VVSTAEFVLAIATAVLALLAPLVAFALLMLATVLVWKYTVVRRRSAGSVRVRR
jgi:hypothetical protein